MRQRERVLIVDHLYLHFVAYHCHMKRLSIGITVHGDCLDTETTSSPNNTTGNFPAIGDQDLVNGGYILNEQVILFKHYRYTSWFEP